MRSNTASQGRLHSWTLHLETASGTSVDSASITVDGGMPQHGHGPSPHARSAAPRQFAALQPVSRPESPPTRANTPVSGRTLTTRSTILEPSFTTLFHLRLG